MQIKTILNKCHKFKRFVYGRAYFAEHEGKQAIYVEIQPRKNSAGDMFSMPEARLPGMIDLRNGSLNLYRCGDFWFFSYTECGG